MTVSAKTIKIIFPEFADIPDTAVEFEIGFARGFHDATKMTSDDYDQAIMLRTAHWLSIKASRSSEGGQLIRTETMGPLSTTYDNSASSGASAPDPADYSTTTYGIRLLQIMGRYSAHVAVV
jgi:hypothetical protein